MMYMPVCKKAIGEVRAYLQKEDFITSKPSLRPGSHSVSPQAPYVFVACSGGRDSLALMWTIGIVGGMYQFNTGAIIVDHHLQKGSSDVAVQTAHTCKKMGIQKVFIEDIDIPLEQQKKQGVEAAARQKRYDALIKVSKNHNNAPILLAHTMDDVAETVILGFLRGLSPRSLAGIAPTTRRENILFGRPFLAMSRQETTQICKNNGIVWWDDPTNGDDINSQAGACEKGDFPLRSQIRHRVLPLLEEMAGRRVKEHLVSISQQEREDNEYLDNISWQMYQKYASYGVEAREVIFTRKEIASIPRSLLRRVFRYAIFVISNEEIYTKMRAGSSSSVLVNAANLAVGYKKTQKYKEIQNNTENRVSKNTKKTGMPIAAHDVDSQAQVSEVKMIYALDKALCLLFQEKGRGEIIISQKMRIVRQYGDIRFIYS